MVDGTKQKPGTTAIVELKYGTVREVATIIIKFLNSESLFKKVKEGNIIKKQLLLQKNLTAMEN